MARAAKETKSKKSKSKDEAPAKKKRGAKDEAPAKKSKRGAKEEKPVKAGKSKRAAKEEKPAKKGKAAKEEKASKGKKSKAEKEDKKSKKAKAKDTEVKKKRGKSRDEDEEDEDAPQPKKGKKGKGADVPAFVFDAYADIDGTLDSIEKDLSMGGGALNLNEQRMSTGLLGLDLVVGKGMVPGWYTVYGPEQSCKSTGAMAIMSSALLSSVPYKAYFDYEGSGEPTYIENMLKTNGIAVSIEDVFGVRDPRSSNWIKKPLIRYQKPQVAERFFDYVYKLEKSLPDKLCVGDDWYYVFDDTKENRKKVGDHFDKNYWRKTKKLRVPAPDGTPQALIVVDSYPAMLPERLDDEDAGAGMAAQARMFSEQIKRIKGRMSSKRIIIVGVNQLRQRPAVMYGSPEYEPCGDALKFYCMTGDTVLYTEKGMLTAEEMERMYSTGTKTSMAGVSGREDCQFFSYKGHSQILRLHTKNGYQVKGKPGHAVLSLEKGSLERKFQKIEDLRPKGGTQGSYVAIKVGSNVWSSQNAKLSGFASYSCKDTGSGVRHLTSWKLPKVMNNDLGAVLGYLVGDGCIREGSIIFSSQEKQQTANFIRAFSGAFKVSESELRKGANAKQVSLHNAEIAAFLAFCGCGSKSSWQKSIPWAVRQSKKSVVASFLSALFDCDGSAGKKSLSYSSVSTTLISQVHTALLNMGIVSKLELVERRFAHGYDKGGMHNTRPSTIQIFGHSYEKFFEEVGFCLDRKSALLATHMKGSNTSYDLVPQLSGYRKGISDRGLLILEQALGIGAGGLIRYRDFESKSWFKKALQLSAELRTQQERTKIRTELEAVKDLMDYTLKNGLYWVEVKGVSSYHEREATFDGNMPKTSTIVTNGIVSHNSDCRLRFNPRALSGVPYPVKGKGMVMEEPSVTVKKGKDQYRFIHVRATKNKLAMPYLETWIRLWIEDGNGDARGFDPVWDTFMYLDNTGQLSHKGMKKIVLKIKKHENAKPMEWMDFKTLIVGTKKQQKEVCERIGLKWFDLRAFTLEQLNKKDGMALFLEHKKSGGEREEGDDEEEGDDGDDAD